MNIVELENIGKKYILKFEKGAIIKDILPRLFIPKERREYWALRGVNLTLKNGQSLGIIGSNGAGKSTLLNIIAGISSPTEGKAKVNGRLSTLLTLGAGFHPELTGVDNIYLNGVILGLKIKEVKNRLEEIIAFSELGDFVKQPIYTYSSGMILRLGFSIAVHMDFDILLIDEILSVGDLPFQDKCLKKINDFKEKKKTLVIASQSLDLIKSLCHQVLLLDKGRLILFGEPTEVIKRYLEMVKEKEAVLEDKHPYSYRLPRDIERIRGSWGRHIGTGEARIIDVKLKDGKGKEKEVFQTGESLRVDVKYNVGKEILNPHFGVAIFREDYLYCYGPNTSFDGIRIKKLRPGIGHFSIIYKRLILGRGNYCISVAIWDEDEKNPYDYYCAYYKLTIGSTNENNGALISIPCYLSIDGKQFKEKVSYFKANDEKSVGKGLIKIEQVKILGRWGREKKIFSLNEALKFLFSIKISEKISSPLIWVSIESQATLVQEACFEIADPLSPGPRKMSVYYPAVPLLRGNCFLSLGIESKSQKESFQCFSKIINWESQATKKDHGIVYLPHKWILKNPEG